MKPPVCGAKIDVVVRREDHSAQVPTPVPGGIWSHQVVASSREAPGVAGHSSQADRSLSKLYFSLDGLEEEGIEIRLQENIEQS